MSQGTTLARASNEPHSGRTPIHCRIARSLDTAPKRSAIRQPQHVIALGKKSIMAANPDHYAENPEPGERPEAGRRPSRPDYAPPAAPAACPACGQATRGELSCQFCGQVLFLKRGLPLATIGLRFGGYVLEGILFVFTVGIGWLVWALFLFPQGQTPAKQLLQMRVVRIGEQRPAQFWRMFLREFIAKPVVVILACFTFFILYLWLFWDRNRQELWDKLASTLVVSDRQGLLRPPQRQDSTRSRTAAGDAWPRSGAAPFDLGPRGGPPEAGPRASGD